MEIVQKDLLSEVPFCTVPLDGRFQIRAGGGGRFDFTEAEIQFLIVIPDAKEIHEQAEWLKALIVFYFDADSHKGLADFIEGLASALIGRDVALLPKVLKLAGDGLRSGEEPLGDFLHWHGAFAGAKILDDLSL